MVKMGKELEEELDHILIHAIPSRGSEQIFFQ